MAGEFPVFCRLAEVRDLEFEDPQKQAEFERWDLGALAAEIREISAACEAAASPCVCSHNDLLSGNIMVPREVGTRGCPIPRAPCLPTSSPTSPMYVLE